MEVGRSPMRSSLYHETDTAVVVLLQSDFLPTSYLNKLDNISPLTDVFNTGNCDNNSENFPSLGPKNIH